MRNSQPLSVFEHGQMLDAVRIGVLCVGADLRISVMNPAAKAMLHVKGDPVGKLTLSATHNTELADALRTALAEGTEISSTITVRHNGKDRMYSIRAARLDGEKPADAPVGAYVFIEDITELRRLEQLRTDFAANVSHELKTPLTSIRGFIETLMEDAVDRDAQLRFLGIIQFETERLTRLIDDILSLSSLESGRGEQPPESLNIEPSIIRAISMLRPRAEEKSIALSLHIEEDLYVLGHPDRLQQMVLNIVENAIKYTPEGGNVDVRAYAEAQRVLIDVIDTGIGLAPDQQARLFERFYRVDKGRSRAMGGTGLGLAIVKHITRSMNGDIVVISELGKGSTFRVRMPMEGSGEGETAESDG